MTSSPRSDTEPDKVPGWRQPWHTWRVLMMVGSLVLLALAFTRAGGESRLPDWLELAVQFLGFGLIAVGFALAMRMRRQVREAGKEPAEKVSPRDRG